MKGLKRIVTSAASVVLLSVFGVTAAQAGSVSTGQLFDNYIGAGNSADALDGQGNNPGNKYDTYWLAATRSGNFLDVTIATQFAGHANGNIGYGDLFIMNGANYQAPAQNGKYDRTQHTSNNAGSANRWQYAFDLEAGNGGDRNNSGYYSNQGGKLRYINTGLSQSGYEDQFWMSHEYKDSYDGRWGQAVIARNTQYTGNNGLWGVSNGLLNFHIDISGIDTLLNASSLAFRWAMTCGNDIIEVAATLRSEKPTQVPEPATLAILLAALSMLVWQRKRQA